MLRVIFLGALRGVMGQGANGLDGVDGSGMALAMLSVFSDFFFPFMAKRSYDLVKKCPIFPYRLPSPLLRFLIILQEKFKSHHVI